MDSKLADVNEAIRVSSAWIAQLRNEMSKVVVGQRYMIDRMIVGLLTGGHILLEGVPGLGKTLAIKALARSIDASFQRKEILIWLSIYAKLILKSENNQIE